MKTRILIYPLMVIGLVLILTNSCKKNDDAKPSNTVSIGQSYQGGKVAYILQPHDPGYIASETHGLIAALSDQSNDAEWGCDGSVINGADGYFFGYGLQNTLDILAGCSTEGTAAKLCSNLTLGGYDDWYLPCPEELNRILVNCDLIGGFVKGYYWTSCEWEEHVCARIVHSPDGLGSTLAAKNEKLNVRAIRSF